MLLIFDLLVLVPTERASVKDMRPDPFKDRYKILFKYKKMPKVEFRYNLREQVKNMKSDILRLETKDISKTRWPNGNHMMFNEQPIFKASVNEKNERKTPDGGTKSTKFFVSDTDVNSDTYTSKYFKRDLRNNPKNEDNVETDPLDRKNFSIETLIENLIGNNFEGKRDIDVESDIIIIDSKENTSTKVPTSIKEPPTVNMSSDMTCVVPVNVTDQNLDENRYIDDPLVKERMNKWKNYTFNEMIAVLAKRIEKQNNTSMEIMKQISTNNIEIAVETTMKSPEIEENIPPEHSVSHKNFTDTIQSGNVSNKSESENVNATKK